MTAPGRRLVRPSRVIVHHSKTVDGDTLSAGAIRRYHVEANGWADIGYHYLVERVAGAVEIILGRPEDRSGAHCRGQNRDSLGVCFVGDFDTTEPDAELLTIAAERLFVPLLRRHGLTPGAIFGDRDFHPSKTCPGSRFDLEAFRELVTTARNERRE